MTLRVRGRIRKEVHVSKRPEDEKEPEADEATEEELEELDDSDDEDPVD
jgi:hypothetical protein